MRVGFIGLGNIGITLANIIAQNGYEVLGWEYHKDIVDEINTKHTNSKFLPEVELDPKLKATKKVSDVLRYCDIIFNAIHSVNIRSTLEDNRGKVRIGARFVNLAKGLDEYGITACGILEELFPENKVIMLTGPTIANELAQGNPTMMMMSGAEKNELMEIARIIDNDFLRVRFSDDRIGLELGGILKNIYAIGLGIMEGENIKSVNFRAVYLTLALEEMTKFGMAMGAKEETFLSVAGVGDLLATSISPSSHNRKMGIMLAKGMSIEQIKKSMEVLPEGYNTLKNMLYLSEKLHVTVPLAQNLWKVIQGKISGHDFVSLIGKNFLEI